MNNEYYDKISKKIKNILGTEYFIYAIKRFGFLDACKRWSECELIPRCKFTNTRKLIKSWYNKDRRIKSNYAISKIAINRDGDLFLVECPECHSQNLYYDKEYKAFNCMGGSYGGHWFTVYPEDGIRIITDFRKGNIHLPNKIVFDTNNKKYYLGILNDAPWWWKRQDIFRDLTSSGYDAHHHYPYKIIDCPLDNKNLFSETSDSVSVNN